MICREERRAFRRDLLYPVLVFLLYVLPHQVPARLASYLRR
jgi:hypothetical protein